MSDVKQCHCGWKSDSGLPHPCHRCGEPGSQRLYTEPGPQRWSLAGAQMKVVARETHACDACWAAFKLVHEAVNAGAAVPKEYDGTMTKEEVFGTGEKP